MAGPAFKSELELANGFWHFNWSNKTIEKWLYSMNQCCHSISSEIEKRRHRD